MNKVYRVVFNEVTATWTVVAETARSRGKRSSLVKKMAKLAAILGLAGHMVLAVAGPPAPTELPTQGQVAAGIAQIGRGGTATAPVLNIDQSSQRAVINWGTFNVGSASTVNFNQPNAQAATLNRVRDANPSQIFGKINAPGQVTLINPAGVYFGKSAVLDVGAVTATTMSQSDDNFMAGKADFARNCATGAVVNEGTIRTALGGYVALLAPQVRNEGLIVAQQGAVVMAGAEAVTLNFDPSSKLASITVSPSLIATLVENKTAVQTPDGLIILSATAMDALTGQIINSGQLNASSLTRQGGRILLQSGKVQLTATSVLEAKGATQGGEVQIQAQRIENAGVVDVSSAQGQGGKVLMQANSTAPAAAIAGIALTPQSQVRADGATRGGEVRLESSHTVQLDYASVSATSTAGVGGAVSLQGQDVTVTSSTVVADGETGGGQVQMRTASSAPALPLDPQAPAPAPAVVINGSSLISASSRRGRGGQISITGTTLLLQDDTRIDATGATGGGEVYAGGGWQGTGDLPQATTVTMGRDVVIDASAIDSGQGGTVVLWSDVHNASAVTTVSGRIDAKGGLNGGEGGRIETSGGTLVFEGLRVDTQASNGSAGQWLLDPYNFFLSSSDLSTVASNLASSNVSISTASNSGSTSFGMGHIVFQDNLTYTGSNSRTLTLTADKDIWINGNISATGSGALGLSLTATDRILLDGDLSTQGGNVSFSAAAVHFQKTSGDQAITTAGGSLDFNSANILLLQQSATGTVNLNTGAGALNLGSGTVQYTSTQYGISAPSLIYGGWGGATNNANGVVSYGISIVAGKEYTTRLYFWDSWDNEAGELHVRRSSDSGYDYYFQAYRTVGGSMSVSNLYGNGAKYEISAESSMGRSGWNDRYVDITFVAKNSGTLTTWTNLNQGIDDESLEIYQVRETGLSSNSGYTLGGRALSLSSTTGQISGAKNFSGLSALTVQTNNASSLLGGVVSGTGTLTKSGSGTLTLTSNQTYTGATNLIAGTLVLSNDVPTNGTSSFAGAGTLRIESASSAFSSAFSTSGWTFDSSLGGLTIGKTGNTANITVPGSLSISGPVALYGGQVDVQSSLTAAGAITLKANGSDVLLGGAVTNNAGSATSFTAEAVRHIRLGANASITSSTSAMTTSLWADTDKSGDGIIFMESSGITTHGGDLTFGKANQTATLGGQSVMVGGDVFFQRSSAQTLDTGGGAVNLYGEAIVSNIAGLTINTANGNVNFYGILNSGNQYSGIYSATALTWLEALDQADNVAGSHLATITSRLENSIAALSVSYNSSWLAGRRLSNGVWQWQAGAENGQSLSYTNWAPGEPNNCCTNINGLGYVGENALQFTGSNGNWNDLFDNGARGATDKLNYYVREAAIASSPVTIAAGTGTVSFKSVGTTKALASLTVTSGSTAINGTGIVTTGAQTYTSNMALTSNATLSASAIAASGDINLGANRLTLNTDSSYEIAGVVSGVGGAMTKQGSGTLTLSGANNFTGGITVSGGLLKAGVATTGAITNSPFGTGTVTVQSGYTVDLNGYAVANAFNLSGVGLSSNGALVNSTSTALTLTGAITLAADTTISSTGDLTLSGVVSSSTGNLAFKNGGNYTLSNASNTIGTIAATGVASLNVANGGTLRVGTVNSIAGISSAGAISLTANALELNGDLTVTTSTTGGVSLLSKTSISNLNLALTTVNTQGGALLMAANIDDVTDGDTTTNGNINLRSGLVANTRGGAITLGGGDTVGSGYALGSSTSALTEGVRFDSRLSLQSGGGDITIRGKSYATNPGNGIGASGVGVYYLSSAGLIDAGSGKVYIDGYSQTTYSDNYGSGIVLALNNSNATTIKSANTTVDAIKLVGIARGTTGGDVFGIEVDTSSPLNIYATGSGGGISVLTSPQNASGYDVVYRSAVEILASSGPIKLLGGQTLSGSIGVAGGQWYQSAAFISDGGYGVAALKISSKVILTGENTYTGTTTLTNTVTDTRGGTVSQSQPDYLTTAKGVLQVGTGAAAGSLSATNITDNGVLLFNSNNTISLSGSINGNGAVYQIGAGTATLTGAATHTGGTYVMNGTLSVGNGGGSGSLSGDVVDMASLVFNRTGEVTYAGVISGTGTVSKEGAGKLTLSGANAYTGATTVAAGTLPVAEPVPGTVTPVALLL